MKRTKFGKKCTAAVLAAAMAVSLMTGCGSGESDSKESEQSAEETEKDIQNDSAADENDSAGEFDKESEEASEGSISEESTEVVSDTEQSVDAEETADSEDSSEELEESEEPADGLTETQRNSINMLNYLTVLTQEINDSKSSRVFLEDAYSSLINNTYPNAVDTRTQAQMTSILDTLEEYRMIAEKRDRLEYIYEQNRAKAMRQAIPNPVGLLSAVSSGSMLKAAASVVYMAVDSASSYSSATSQADMQYLQDGWQLDDEEAAELHKSRTAAFSYMINMVRDNSLPGDYALNEEAVQQFVEWKNNDNLVRRIAWLETNQETYKVFGPYWLALGKSYYENEEYEKCLEAIKRYSKVSSRIFRKDFDYAEALPMAIISAKETCEESDYITIAGEYAQEILDNTNNDDWTLRYFAAQIYLELYSKTENSEYIEAAYNIAFDNVNNLVDEQSELNAAYLADVVEAEAKDGATKREKKEVKEYNKMLKEERKTALPPVSEAVYLNCDLLFALAEEMDISEEEQNDIEAMIHDNGEPLFLAAELDKKFWFSGRESIDPDSIEITFDGDSFKIPVTCVTDSSSITVTVISGNDETVFADWSVKEVKRPKNADYTGFIATFTSKEAKDYTYVDGDKIQIDIVPVQENEDETIVFQFNVTQQKKLKILTDTNFERITEA